MDPSRGYTEADFQAAVDAAVRAVQEGLGLPPPGSPEGFSALRRILAICLLAAALIALLPFLRPGARRQPAHLVEADLRWAVARVVEHAERERALRGRIPSEGELRFLLGETLAWEATDEGAYRVVGSRAGVSVEYDGTVPLEEWSVRVSYPPGSDPP